MMVTMNVSPLLLLLAAALLSHSTAVELRGTKEHVAAVGNDFTCSLEAFDADSCLDGNSKDDNGSSCVWCQLNGVGICVSQDQSSFMEQVLPQVECQTTIVVEESDVKFPDNFWECLQEHEDEGCGSLDGCTWCDTEAGFGVCLADAAAKATEECDFFDCTPSNTVGIAAPIDPECLAAGMGSDDAQIVCDETMDSNGEKCVWCNAAGVFGLCVSNEQSQSIGQYLQCDNAFVVLEEEEDLIYEEEQEEEEVVLEEEDDLLVYEEEEEEEVKSPFDPACFAAAWQSDNAEEACRETKDDQGNDCLWCTVPTGDTSGVCLNPEQADVAGRYFTCNGVEREEDIVLDDDEVMSPFDSACIKAAYGSPDGRSTCHSTQDEEGSPCQWCFSPQADESMGLCLNGDQAAYAGQYLICEDAIEEELELLLEESSDDEVAVASPLDPSCILAGFQSPDGKQICDMTQDQDGDPCIWCVAPQTDDDTAGLCLNSDQAQIAGGYLTCEQGIEVENKNEKEKEIVDPFDSSCLIPSFQNPDGQSICASSVDEDGLPCKWCLSPTDDDSLGLCLTSDQAAIIGNWLSCEDLEEDVVSAVA